MKIIPSPPEWGKRVRVRGRIFTVKTRKSLCISARDILVAAIRIRGIPRLSSAACRQVPENSRTSPPFEKGGSGGISIVILVTQKSVIPNPPSPLPCHPESTASPPVSSRIHRLPSRVIPNPPPPLPCHPESTASPPVSSRGASATRDLQWRTQTGGWPKPEKNPRRDHRKT
jgi:hypothetical protein